jgi:hypothetical protein
MNMETAQQIADIVTQLAVAVSQYQAKFGKNYQITETSNPEAVRLHNTIRTHEASIARRLDIAALKDANKMDNAWWKRMDVMDNAVISGLSKNVYHLISCCAYPENQYNLHTIQSVIAGCIDPDIRFPVMNQVSDIQAIS